MELVIHEIIICDYEIDGVDMSDYPDLCDAHISRAWWRDTTGVKMRELTEEELDKLHEEKPEWVFEQIWKSIHFH